MALTVDYPEAEGLARALAERTGESLEEAVVRASRERLERVSRPVREERGENLCR